MTSQAHFVLTEQGELIRYPTIAIAKAMWLDQSVVYTRPQHMTERLTLDEMNSLYRRITKDNDFKYTSKEVAAEKLFPLICVRANPHNPRIAAAMHKRKHGHLLPSTEHDVHPKDPLVKVPLTEMRLVFASASVVDHVSTKICPQAYALAKFLGAYQPEGGYTWDGLAMDVNRMHDENLLITRQPPMRIFKYYTDTLIEHGLLTFTDKEGRPCDRPRNKRNGPSVVVVHPLKLHKGSLT